MEEMYQTYKDVAEFFIVYVAEAHASDDRFPVGYAKDLGIKEHTTYGQRCAVAQRLVDEKKLNIPCLIDQMSNGASKAYQALPDRLYLVDRGGRLAVAGKRGPWGFKPAMDQAIKWLAVYKDSGVEPAPGAFQEVDSGEDYRELAMRMNGAYTKGDYQQALDLALKMNGMMEGDPGTMYNIACMQSLLGHKSDALDWLAKAIDAGYRDTDHLLADDDFKSIRAEQRFADLVKRTRSNSGGDRAMKGTAPGTGAIVGDWAMKTDAGGQSIEAIMSLSVANGQLVGMWKSMGREMKMTDLKIEGNRLSFKRAMGPEQVLSFTGSVDGNAISGAYKSDFGEMPCKGKRK